MMNNKQEKSNFKKYIYWVIVVFYLITIFYFSSQDGRKSHEVSAGLLQYILTFVSLLPEKLLDFFFETHKNYEFFLRKAAHFTEYLILALLFYRAMVVSDVRVKKNFIITFIFCFLYAISDEVHQIFVPGRAFAIKDILIDTSGAALGLGIIAFIKVIKNRREIKKLSRRK